MDGLFNNEIKGKPDRETLASAALEAAKEAVSRRFRSHAKGQDRDDLAQEVAIALLESNRLSKWNAGGKYSLAQFAYVAAGFALTDFLRIQKLTGGPFARYARSAADDESLSIRIADMCAAVVLHGDCEIERLIPLLNEFELRKAERTPDAPLESVNPLMVIHAEDVA